MRVVFEETRLKNEDNPPWFRSCKCVGRNRSDKRGEEIITVHLKDALWTVVLIVAGGYSVPDSAIENSVIRLKNAPAAVVYKALTGD